MNVNICVSGYQCKRKMISRWTNAGGGKLRPVLTMWWQFWQTWRYQKIENDENVGWSDGKKSGIDCGVGSQRTLSQFFSTRKDYFNISRQKVPYFYDSRQKMAYLNVLHQSRVGFDCFATKQFRDILNIWDQPLFGNKAPKCIIVARVW